GDWQGARVGLAHTRLAIIDAEGGAQPLTTADGRYTIAFNGEIYNYRALRRELERDGYTFKTASDTEVIPACIQRFGRDAGLRRLRGMFAFALWDSVKRTLLLARDRFGIKPLYVARAGSLRLFASEPKAVLEWPELSREADPVALLDFFTLGEALAPRTAFRMIEELPPGAFIELVADTEHRGAWWRWPERQAIRRSTRHALRELEDVLTDSVRAHLVSDVPVGAFLSGGIDSSVVVALWRRQLGGRPATFTARFAEREYDESQHARRVAAVFDTDHHELLIQSSADAPELFSRIVGQYDQPFGDSSCIPTWLVCREMARHGKVVLAGDGGDEAFGGYPRYALVRVLEQLGRSSLALMALRAGASALARPSPERSRQLAKLAEFAELPATSRGAALHTLSDAARIEQLFAPEFHELAYRHGPTALRLGQGLHLETREATEGLMELELHRILPGDFLRKVDVASSAHGLEVRTPYLDTEVFEFARSLRADDLARLTSQKHLLRQLARRHLPRSTVERTKQGFALNFDTWMGSTGKAFLEDLLLSPNAWNRDWLRRTAVQGAVRDCFDGRDNRTVSRYQAYNRVFLLASFELWLRRWAPTLPSRSAIPADFT
ncbi:MAG TPA: asparagine synthase (glutamine-hydrolyzing), partial [Polyangiaceae bacterium]|nr:asparagine synthase (glutamine-hydrolyzing) [Polyangiaceae bacterium]